MTRDPETIQKDAAWGAGYRAGRAGAEYSDNPLTEAEGATAWAFGCSEGWRDRNRSAFDNIMHTLRTHTRNA